MSSEEENYIEPIFPLPTKEGSSPDEEEDIDLVKNFTFGNQEGGKIKTIKATEGEFVGLPTANREAIDFLEKNQVSLINSFNETHRSAMGKVELPPIYLITGTKVTDHLSLDDVKNQYGLQNLDTTPFYYLHQLSYQLKTLFLIVSNKLTYNPAYHGNIDINVDAFENLKKTNLFFATTLPKTYTNKDQIQYFLIPALGEIIVRLYLLEYTMIFSKNKFCYDKITGEQKTKIAQRKNPEQKVDYLYDIYVNKKQKNLFSDFLTLLKDRLPVLTECFLGPSGLEDEIDRIFNLVIPFGKNLLFSKILEEYKTTDDDVNNHILSYYVENQYFKTNNEFLKEMAKRAKLAEASAPPSASSTTTPPPITTPPPTAVDCDSLQKLLDDATTGLSNKAQLTDADVKILMGKDPRYDEAFIKDCFKDTTKFPVGTYGFAPPPPKTVECDDVKKLLDDPSVVADKLNITSAEISNIIDTLKKAGFSGVSSPFIITCIVGFNTDPANPIYKITAPASTCAVVQKYLNDVTLVPDPAAIQDADVDAIVKQAIQDGVPGISKLKIETCIISLGAPYVRAPAVVPALTKVADCTQIKTYLDNTALVADKAAITDAEIQAITTQSVTDGFQPIEKATISTCLADPTLNPDPVNPVYKFAVPLVAGPLKPADCNDIKALLDNTTYVADITQITDPEIDGITKASSGLGFIDITKDQINTCLRTLNQGKNPGDPDYYALQNPVAAPPPPAGPIQATCDDVETYLNDVTLVPAADRLAITDAQIDAIIKKAQTDNLTPIDKAFILTCLGTINLDPDNPTFKFAPREPTCDEIKSYLDNVGLVQSKQKIQENEIKAIEAKSITDNQNKVDNFTPITKDKIRACLPTLGASYAFDPTVSGGKRKKSKSRSKSKKTSKTKKTRKNRA